MKVDKFRLFIFFLVGVIIVSWTIRSKRMVLLTGETMGTTYTVRAYTSLYLPESILQGSIDNELLELSKEMSTYDPLSDISLLNTQGVVTPEFRFLDVWSVSQRVFLYTQGAFNPAIKPLLDVWGVGSDEGFRVPQKQAIDTALKNISLMNFDFLPSGEFIRTNDSAKLDFSAVAKGYGVDRAIEVLKSYGIKMAYVEIGGEVRVLGSKPLEKPWRLGLQDPTGALGALYGVVDLVDSSMATSGDYRQYFEHEGTRYSHILDPRTGYPIRHNVASVTVIAPTCVEADAFATGFMILSPEDTIRITESLNGIETLVLRRNDDNTYTEYKSSGFDFTRINN
jgi:thiamine biosynthesis lipoprotein